MPRSELTPANLPHCPAAYLPGRHFPTHLLPYCPARLLAPPAPQLFVMFIAQGALVRWRKRHKRRCGSQSALPRSAVSEHCAAAASIEVSLSLRGSWHPSLHFLNCRPCSYDLATLVGLWLIPPIISVQLGALLAIAAAAFSSLPRNQCVPEPTGVAAQPPPSCRRRHPRASVLPAS